jgi:hypothetical protein
LCKNTQVVLIISKMAYYKVLREKVVVILCRYAGTYSNEMGLGF